MAPATRRRLEPEVRRLELLLAAERLIAARGGAVRVEDVVAAAGAAKGTFFRYFATWHDLLEALRERAFHAYEARLAEAAPATGPTDWPHAFCTAAEVFVDFNVELQGLHDALFHSDFTLARPAPPHLDASARLAAMIRAAQAAGAFGELDAETTAPLLFAVIHQAADGVRAGADRVRTLAAMRLMLRRALGASA